MFHWGFDRIGQVEKEWQLRDGLRWEPGLNQTEEIRRVGSWAYRRKFKFEGGRYGGQRFIACTIGFVGRFEWFIGGCDDF
jgi:hypothetical protein